MKKKALLLVLPALMVLAGCSGVNAQPKEQFMVDSTLANEDVFGEAKLGGDIGLRKGSPNKAFLPADTISLGYQIKFDDKGNADSADDTISIRFVAALKQIDGIVPVWRRALAEADGTNTQKPFDEKEDRDRDGQRQRPARDPQGDGYAQGARRSL